MLLSPVISKLVGKRVVLASGSPRRQDILTNMGLRFEVVPSWFRETLDKSTFSAPHEYAVETAKQKALEVARRMHLKHHITPDIVVGADTIVTLEDSILEKPVDKQDAYNMLSRMSGKEHSVFTGVAIVLCKSENDNELETEVIDFYEETKVKFADLSEELLRDYIDSGEPMDKAGGYGIQALGGMLVEYVHGDFLNVVGFPLNHFCKKLAELYYPPPKNAIQRIKHDSIPYVETFEDLSDAENESSTRTQCPKATKTLDVNDLPPEGKAHRASGSTAPYTCGRMSAGNSGHAIAFPSKMIRLLDGFKASKALFVACRLKVFDILKERGLLRAMDVANKRNISVSGTERLLDVCVALGLLEKTHQAYSNTELANTYLATDSEYSLHDYIMYSNDHLWPFFTNLDTAVKEGTTLHRETCWKNHEHLHQETHQDMLVKQHLSAMHSIVKVTGRAIVTAFDLSRMKSACDLGGGTGALAHELVQIYPNLKVTVFDLPHVIENISSFQPLGQCAARVTFTKGDFFKDSLPEADLYILSRVLHHYSDEQLHTLLTRVSDSCKPGNFLLVAEIVLDEDKRNPRALLQSLSMIEGKQRSGSEYKRLLQKYGFSNIQIKITGNVLDAILAVKG
ncbi:putative bifunctional dTTP/UTP pyrophosphatase/methyltransferase protein isoform X1 [Microcaecilia unicolor]|uniref:Probable bifunctional dTTP/UTP pyrophosphatase/methyltransferase protein isoform X1 n=1 Tax=Microcaecilia unicolor TaxID=1415580 RepID=A0A6P7XYF1_9AMPH|nr:probable bifunctional dTTP/UTP pyrophosphatase/methyltransferase protein isoform X1 [Microcaecilia unicolor]